MKHCVLLNLDSALLKLATPVCFIGSHLIIYHRIQRTRGALCSQHLIIITVLLLFTDKQGFWEHEGQHFKDASFD